MVGGRAAVESILHMCRCTVYGAVCLFFRDTRYRCDEPYYQAALWGDPVAVPVISLYYLWCAELKASCRCLEPLKIAPAVT